MEKKHFFIVMTSLHTRGSFRQRWGMPHLLSPCRKGPKIR